MELAQAAGPIFELDRLLALASVAIAALYTPGPNNMMLAASGATFGFRRTIPHMLGVALGFGAMFFTIALLLGQVFQSSPLFAQTLKWVGAALMLWLAYRVATAGRSAENGAAKSRPFTFIEASAFQWINPKAWTMAVATSATFITGTAPLLEAGAMAGLFAALGTGSASAWAGLGAVLQRWLSTELRLRLFNGLMGVLIAGYVVMMLLE